MIKRLRMRFMLSIMTVVVTIIVCIILILIFTSTPRINRQVEQDMWLSAINVYNGVDVIDSEHKGYYYYMKTDKDNNIIKASKSPLPKEELTKFIAKVIDDGAQKGVYTTADNKSYTFIIDSFGNKNENIIVFTDSNTKTITFFHQIFVYVVILILAVILSFLGSIFLSRMAIIPVKKAWDKQVKFTADASHELRTPLTAIQTNLDVLTMSKEETIESQMKWIKNIAVSNERMRKLVEELLLIAQSDSGELCMENLCFDISDALREVIDPLEPVAEANGLKIVLNIEPRVFFKGDKSLIQQLIVIFLDNAIKYTPEGGIIEVDLTTNRGKIELLVSDTGKGIDHKQLDKIFDRFYKVDKSRARKKSGSGLGLSIAKDIVTAHGGIIKVESIVDNGTCFTVTFKQQLSEE